MARLSLSLLIGALTVASSGAALSAPTAAPTSALAPGPTPAIEPPVLRAALSAEPRTLDWARARASADRFLAHLLMRGLLRYDEHAHLICDLCRSWSTDPAGKRLEFVLGDEAWSDGARLEARHFVDAFRMMPPGPAEFRLIEATARGGAAGAFGVRALAPDRLEIRLTRPSGAFAHFLTTPAAFPIRKELADPKGTGERHATAATLGPYVLAAWEHGRRIVLEGNPRYTGVRPVFRVDFALGTHAALVDRFGRDRLDLLPDPSTDDALKLRGARKPQLNPFWALRSIRFNFRRALPAQLATRQAILRALDREMLPSLLKNGERPATAWIPPDLPGHRELPLTTPDPAQALQARAQAHADGTPTLELLIENGDTERGLAQWLNSRLESIRFKLRTRALPTAEYRKELAAGHFDLALTLWSYQIASPLEFLQTLQTGRTGNWGGWTHVAYDSLVDQLAISPTIDVGKRLDVATQILESQEIPLIPLDYPTQAYLLGNRVIRFVSNAFGEPDLTRIELRR